MKKYLLWDFDNTLAYRDGMWTQTIYELLQEEGMAAIKLEDISPHLRTGFPWHTPELSHEEFFKGNSWWEHMNLYFSKIIFKLGADEILACKISSRIKEKYLDASKWSLYEDTIPCLIHAKEKGYENIIVSNHVPELVELVEKLGLTDFFSEIYTSAKIGFEKPNINFFKKVLNELGETSNVIMIGDNYRADVEGATNAGIKAVLIDRKNCYTDNTCIRVTNLLELLDNKVFINEKGD